MSEKGHCGPYETRKLRRVECLVNPKGKGWVIRERGMEGIPNLSFKKLMDIVR